MFLFGIIPPGCFSKGYQSDTFDFEMEVANGDEYDGDLG